MPFKSIVTHDVTTFVRGDEKGYFDLGGSTIVVRGEAEEREVRLVVEDDGPGLDPKIEGRLFEPFATTKPPGEGTGLGLYTSYMLVQNMDGSLSLSNRPDARGARAVVTFAVPPLLAAESIVAQRRTG